MASHMFQADDCQDGEPIFAASGGTGRGGWTSPGTPPGLRPADGGQNQQIVCHSVVTLAASSIATLPHNTPVTINPP